MRALRSTVVLGFAVLCRFAVPGPAGASFADPPEAGKVIWMFTGAKSVGQGPVGTVSTSVHCSSFDPRNTAELSVEFFNEVGVMIAQGILRLLPGTQGIVSTRGTFYAEAVTGGPDFQGSVRVVAVGSSAKTICSAYVMSTADPPTFAFELPRFNKAGKP
jgi:hypothetical protein